jgi:hypothetical protein
VDESTTIRVLHAGSNSVVVALSGVVDATCVPRLATEVDRRGDRRVIVDVVDATYVDADVQSFLIAAAEQFPLTVVADSWLLHVFELQRHSHSLRLNRSLYDAVAATA